MNDAALALGTSPAPPFVAANAISKAFGGAQALRAVSLSIVPGEVHGLVGANGAGKSTLIRILAGLTQPDSGEIVVDGRRVAANSPHIANELGMSFIHQELAFVPGMTVLENMMLGLPKKTRFGLVDWPAIARQIAPIANRVGVRAPLTAVIIMMEMTAERSMILPLFATALIADAVSALICREKLYHALSGQFFAAPAPMATDDRPRAN